MMKCGLLGEKLGHSYSPAIHEMLADYEYKLYEKAPDELGDFLTGGELDAMNVTIPYKKSVIPYCAELSEMARAIGSVNTIVRRPDGSLFGDNTDAFGFESLIRRAGIDVKGKKALVLGSGGASVTAVAVLKKLGADPVRTISRSGEFNYSNLDLNADAAVIANATPVGMFPKTGVSAVDLRMFPQCEAVLDVVYNPHRTALMLQAEELGIANAGGLYMLVAQAKRSSEIFTGSTIPDSEIDRIEAVLLAEMQNIVLIGMPGSGKTTIAAALSQKTGRPVLEADEEIVKKAGMSIPDIFAKYGEDRFRQIETEVLSDLGKASGTIISTGGGCVTRPENYPLLHQNGVQFCIRRDLSALPKDGRPISLKSDMTELYNKRKPMYERFADVFVDNDGTPEEAADKILAALKGQQ